MPNAFLAFQIDKKDRPIWEDVFGFLFKLSFQKNNLNISIQYQYASPWLYTNNGIFTNYKHNGFPLGIRYPHSQFIELDLSFKLEEAKLQTIIINIELLQKTLGE